MKYTEELLWILDKPGMAVYEMDEKFRENIAFVHSLGLKSIALVGVDWTWLLPGQKRFFMLSKPSVRIMVGSHEVGIRGNLQKTKANGTPFVLRMRKKVFLPAGRKFQMKAENLLPSIRSTHIGNCPFLQKNAANISSFRIGYGLLVCCPALTV